MIKLIIKLAIVAVLANAAWHVMTVYASHYKFKDAVQQTTQFGNDKSRDQLKSRIIALAADYDLPLAEDEVTVKRETLHTIVDASYVKSIELFPGYIRPFTFTVHTDTFSEAPMTGER